MDTTPFTSSPTSFHFIRYNKHTYLFSVLAFFHWGRGETISNFDKF
jgi:hypothetical protein